MSEPIFGWPLPVSGDVANVPYDMRALADGVAATLQRVIDRVQAGKTFLPAGTLQPGGSSSVQVTFPTPFQSPPVVSVDSVGLPGGSGQVVLKAGSITVTGARVYAYNVGDTAAVFAAWEVSWVAVGDPA